ncbi:MAG: lycopene cyclase domain-containing protein [Salibacteraceae bacterium]
MATLTYVLINVLTILVPLVRSFESRVNMFGKWKALFPAIFLTGFFFLVWDVWFTQMGVWGFNERYLSGIEMAGLPLGEYLFFLTVPYACIFVYEVLNYFIKKDHFAKVARPVMLIGGVLLLVLAWVGRDQWYSGLNFLLTGLWMLGMAWLNPRWMGRYLQSYLVCIFPFLLVNGILTGSFIEEQVVWYNDAENFGLRIFTIPVEDTAYAMLLLAMNTTFYEAFKKRMGIGEKALNTKLAVGSVAAG